MLRSMGSQESDTTERLNGTDRRDTFVETKGIEVTRGWEYEGICCSVTKLCLAVCEPMNCSMLSSPVLYYLLEFGSNSCLLSQ